MVIGDNQQGQVLKLTHSVNDYGSLALLQYLATALQPINSSYHMYPNER
jgi:hypothetical protein